MDDKPKVYTPEVVPDAGFPLQGSPTTAVTSSTQETANQTYGAKEMAEQSFPLKMVAKELLSTALNTITKKINKTFEFTKSGAIQIGEYINGLSGDVKISPDGIVARNNAGTTTFALDGDTGDAIFTGDVRASTFTSDYFSVDAAGNVIARSIRLTNTDEKTVALDSNIDCTNGTDTLIPGTSLTISLDRETVILFLFSVAGDVEQNGVPGADFNSRVTFKLVEQTPQGRVDLATMIVVGSLISSVPSGAVGYVLPFFTHYLGSLPAGTHNLNATIAVGAGTGSAKFVLNSCRLSYLTIGTT